MTDAHEHPEGQPDAHAGHDHAGHGHSRHAHGVSADADRGKLTIRAAVDLLTIQAPDGIGRDTRSTSPHR